jgi:DNA-binding NarL/FixJ family response regulator
MPATTVLLEREDELAAIDRALDSATAGNGGVLAVEGEAGIGKTSLLDAAAALGAERGMTVLFARGGEHERDFPYGIVRQLFEAPLAAAGGDSLLAGAAALAVPVFDAAATAEVGGDPFGIQHGLYWLAADLAERAPLAIVVDDVQWADLASLRALAYIGHRLAGLPLLLAVGIRVGEPDAHEEPIDELRREARRGWLRPRPLGVDAVAELVARELGGNPADGFAEACRAASAGNPFLVGEVLNAFAGDGTAPSDGKLAASVAAAGAARSILLRLVRLGDDALATARAVAVLEPNATPLPVAALAELAPDAVVEATDRLVAARLLADATPLVFAHPLVRAAVYEDLSQPRRAALHVRAARLLSEHAGARDAVAGHLLRAEPAGDPWAAAELRAAAAAALGQGAPGSAVSYLRRALAEPPPKTERDALTLELGRAQLRADDLGGIATLTELRSRSRRHAADVQLTTDLAVSLAVRGRTREAVPILRQALVDTDRRSADGWFLRATLLVLSIYGFEELPRDVAPEPGESIDPETLPGRMLLELWAFLVACGAGDLGDAAGVARGLAADRDAALADAQAGYPPLAMCIILALTGAGAEAEAIFEEMIETTRRRGVLSGVAAGIGIRSLSRAANSDLRAAEVDAGTALAIVAGNDHVLEANWLAILVRVLTARGELADAEAALAGSAYAVRPPSGMPGAILLCARGELHLAAGRHAEARDDFRAAAARLEWLPHANEELLGWRVGLARAEAALGEHDAAATLAAEAVAAAHATANPRSLGIALRAQGQLAVDGGVEALREAVEVLAGTDAGLQHAHALVDLGAALRRANRRRDAREPLREGLDLAHRCGATALEERARTELAATGARPRRATLTGVEALTPSELRVARMAADGLTNREIAQQLFVTAKTVETHLRHVYQKLDVARRTELAPKL